MTDAPATKALAAALFAELMNSEQLARSMASRALPRGMQLSHFSVLNLLAHLNGERTPAELAQAFRVTRGAMTNTLARLEWAGHIHIRPDWDDARRKFVSISPAGRAARDAALASLLPRLACVVRDIGVELSRRALDEQDLDLARWSAARALVAAPGDEILLAARIRTEHLAGNAASTERLCLQLAAQARALGVETRLLRPLFIAAATLVTAAAVSVTGVIGWIGLIIPHVARLVVGPDFRRLLPASVLMGAGYLLAVDLVARTIAPIEVPLGILTALIGAPFFLWLLRRRAP